MEYRWTIYLRIHLNILSVSSIRNCFSVPLHLCLLFYLSLSLSFYLSLIIFLYLSLSLYSLLVDFCRPLFISSVSLSFTLSSPLLILSSSPLTILSPSLPLLAFVSNYVDFSLSISFTFHCNPSLRDLSFIMSI